MKREFSRQIFEKYSNINFMKIRPLEAELLHAEARGEAKSLFSILRSRLIKDKMKGDVK
jgi:hypothetical protein